MTTVRFLLPATLLLSSPALPQSYVFDTGDTEYALSMGPSHIPGELAMLHGFAAQGPGGTDILSEIQVAIGTATQPAGLLDGQPIVVAIWDDPNDDFDPIDAVLLYSSAPVPVTQSNTDVKVPYAVPGVPVSGVFYIGAITQDLGNFPAGADIGVPTVGHPVSWLVGEGPGASLDLTDLAGASYSLFDIPEGFLLSATGGGQPGSIGSSYCGPALPNSTGMAATIRATGSPVVTSGTVSLVADALPAGELGYFLAGMTEGLTIPPGSSGVLCLQGVIGRYNRPAEVIQGPSGSLALDLGAIPLSPPRAVAAGETWLFQCWYRDGTTSNFTDGVRVTFQ